MIDISIILPTRGRPEFLERLLKSIAETTANPAGVEIVLRMDEDDTGSHGVDHPGLNIKRMIRPPGGAMGAITNETYAESTGRYIFLMNDDVVFRTRGWDTDIIKAFASFPDDIALIYGNDMDQGEHVPTFPVLSRRCCELMGRVCPSEYLNLHIESHLLDIFRQLKARGHDRVLYLEETVFEHLHFILGKSGHDNTYIKKDEAHDHRLFLSYADERTFMAIKLDEYIKEPGARGSLRAGMVKKERQAKRVSVRRIYVAGEEPEVTVIITGTGRDAGAKKRLCALLSQNNDDLSFEVLSADADSALSGAEEAPGKGEVVEVLEGEQNPESPSVYNSCARLARGRYLVFISGSVAPQAGWLTGMLKHFAGDNAPGAVGCKLLDPRSGRVTHAGIAFYNDSGEVKGSYIYRGFRQGHAAVNRRRELQAVSAKCFMADRDLFLKVEGFDTAPGGLSGVGLFLKIIEEGRKVLYVPEPVARYGGGMVRIPLSSADGASKAKEDLVQILATDGFHLSKAPDGRISCKPGRD